MKRNLLIGAMLLIGVSTYAQTQKNNVGIGTTKPDESAVLDVSSFNKGFLTPRMTLQQRLAIQNPTQGLEVFQTDMLSGKYYYDGNAWKQILTTDMNKSVAGTDGDWGLSGNNLATDLGSPGVANAFIGTTAASQPLNFKVEGTPAGQIGTNATGNNSFGYNSLISISTGTDNSAIGKGALQNNTAGSYNAAIGSYALQSNLIGNYNMAVGVGALNLNGQGAATNTQGSSNVAIGNAALYVNTLGSDNVGIGNFANRTNTTGDYNMAIGSYSLYGNQTGSRNTGIGIDAVWTSGNNNRSDNVGIGFQALRSTTTLGSSNVAVGVQAGQNATGSGNLFLGYNAGIGETNSNMIYLSNKATNPLFKGSFGSNANGDGSYLKVHLGTTVPNNTTGFLAIGDFSAASPSILNFGNGSGTNSFRLVVQDGILTEKLKVAIKGTAEWADYVFEKEYKLMDLTEVEKFIKENKHLPNVPSAEELTKSGLDMATTSAKLMEKIEELTLYIIQLKKEINEIKDKK